MISPARVLISTFVLCLLFGWVSALAQTTFPEVSTSGGLASHSIGENELLQFTITIANKVDHPTSHRCSNVSSRT